MKYPIVPLYAGKVFTFLTKQNLHHMYQQFDKKALLDLLLERSTDLLHNIFIQRWNNCMPTWNDDEQSGQLLLPFMKNAFAAQKNMVAEGKAKQWDISLLANILLVSNGWDNQVSDQSTQALIENLRKARNDFVHIRIKNLHLNEMWETLSGLMIGLGDNADELYQIKKDWNIDFLNDDNIEEVIALKEKGNAFFKQGHYVLAAELYTQGVISGSRISLYEKAVLHSNRSAAYLALFNNKTPLEEKTAEEEELFNQWTIYQNFAELSLDDSEKAIEYQRDWWKGYYRKGLALESLKENDKALSAYEKATILENPTKTAESALFRLRLKLGKDQRQDHLNPKAMPMLFSERLENLHAKTGGSAHPRMISKMKEVLPPAEKAVLTGHQYRDGDTDVKQDYEMAVKYYSKAASLNNPDGIYNLALLYKNGLGVEQNIQFSFNLFKRAAEMDPKIMGDCPNTGISILTIGVAEAQHVLGNAYAEGLGCVKDLCLASDWYKKASENGSPESAHNLGLFYWKGKGVQLDLIKAEQYLSLGAYRGNTSAMISLAYFLLQENYDFNGAEMYFERAIRSGSVLAQATESEFKQELKKKCTYFAYIVTWEKKKNLPATNLTNKQRFERFLFGSRFSINDFKKLTLNPQARYREKNPYSIFEKLLVLEERSKNHSTYANRMIYALQSCMKSMMALGNDNEQSVAELAQCYLLEHSVASIPSDMLENYRETVVKLLLTSKVNTTLDLNLKICRSILFMQNNKETVLFLDSCIKDYPNVDFFWNIRGCMKGFMKKYEEGIIDVKESIRLKPDRFDYLYDKAAMLRLCDSSAFESVIAAYQDFIDVSPSDHRKLPESYYAITVILFYIHNQVTPEAQRYYNLGLEAEKSQFPFYLPYESANKILSLPIFASPNQSNSYSKPSVSKDEFLSDPLRIEMIITYRQKLSDMAKLELKDHHFMFSTWKPPKTQTLHSDTFEPITLKDMDPTIDKVYEGKVLEVTIFERAFTYVPSIHVLIFDCNKSMQRLFIYGHPREVGLNLISEVYLPGTKLKIFNPYFRLCNDGKPAIRVDNPNSIVLGVKNNICSACGTVDATKTCAKCKRVYYCSRECQVLDWKVYKHNLICPIALQRKDNNNAKVFTMSHSG
ncbi:hypothetical protein HDV01_002702 [Terramyces sp. JEL0728]|nr:hypothetical protein HDV01_002702 [Terramyces sp. JEL0728]